MANFTPGVVEGLVLPDDHAPSFSALIERVENINFLVRVPAATVEWFDAPGFIPVLGLIEHLGVRATLVPKPANHHSLYLNAAMRDALEVGEGDSVVVTLWHDRSDRGPVLPADVTAALDARGLSGAFDALPPSHQREYLVWIEDAKRSDTRSRRVLTMIDQLDGS